MTRGTLPAATAHATRKLGRPPGNYTQYRRLSQLRDLLENHPKGISLLELGRKLHVTDRSIRRYLRELEREVDVERTADPEGLGGVVVRIPTRDLPRRVKLHRTQIYGLLMARRVFKMLDGTVLDFDEENLLATSFTLKNPHATSTCGCGESFSAKAGT